MHLERASGEFTLAPVESWKKSGFHFAPSLDCQVYVGLYQSAIDYLPGAIAPDQSVEVSVEKHVMRMRVPGDREITLEITRRYSTSPGSCNSGRYSRWVRSGMDGCKYA